MFIFKVFWDLEVVYAVLGLDANELFGVSEENLVPWEIKLFILTGDLLYLELASFLIDGGKFLLALTGDFIV
jgi:hypothetical protein